MKKIITLLCAVMLSLSMVACNSETTATTTPDTKEEETTSTTYSLVQNVHAWGSTYGSVIVKGTDTDYHNYKVEVERFDTAGAPLNDGERVVFDAYASDAEGNPGEGYVTIVLEVSASEGLGQPYYTDPNTWGGALKSWATCNYTVTNTATGEVWNELDTVYHPDEEGFESSEFTSTNGTTMTYVTYAPEEDGAKHPLIVWLHGAGSGGTDAGFVTGGMEVTNWKSEETQHIFGGAYVLMPQCPTVFMDGGEGYSTDGVSIYTEPVKELIDQYIFENEGIDAARVYVGGCSNGGYMTLALEAAYPELFAAGFPVCECYADALLSDEQLANIASIPNWFVTCAGDPVVDPEANTVPTYERLVEIGAEDLHFTYLSEIRDPDYGNTYVKHFAWVYALRNLVVNDYDGSIVQVNGHNGNLYKWLAAHTK